MARHTIVLAHGILGFGSIPGWASPLNYFNGVAAHLGQQGHLVIAPQVNPVGSVALRGAQLKNAILQAPLLDDQPQLHVSAHSMGGLDARFALQDPQVAARVKTLVTIGTPHRGSPVADAVANRMDPLFAYIPEYLLQFLQNHAGAVHGLTTEFASQFDASTPDAPGVRFIEVAGDASQAGRELILFRLASAIGQIKGEINDGVVCRSSALRPNHEHLDDWPVDHAGEIGWSLDPRSMIPSGGPLFAPPNHLERYDTIVQML
jgi:triacylglycerol lipase